MRLVGMVTDPDRYRFSFIPRSHQPNHTEASTTAGFTMASTTAAMSWADVISVLEQSGVLFHPHRGLKARHPGVQTALPGLLRLANATRSVRGEK